ncbi:hypothetical protein RCO48_03045 [Peribacillus frigoritolerans]|nr:hypothetical protein [Peribacillus frigoritolerans]
MKQPNLVVLPGWGMEKEAFQPLIQPLSEAFNLSFIDWRDMKALNDFEERVINTIASIDGPVYLLGWSLGSLVSLELSSSFSRKNKRFYPFWRNKSVHYRRKLFIWLGSANGRAHEETTAAQ